MKKSAKRFSSAMLPSTRVELFKLTYRTQLSFLIKLSLLTSLFALPLFLCMILIGMLGGAVPLDAENVAELFRAYLTNRIYIELLYVPAVVMLFVGFAGAFTLTKKYVCSDGYSVAKSFFGGIRDNGREYVIHGTIFGVLFYLVLFARNFAAVYNAALYVPMTIVGGVIFIIAADCAAFTACALPIYANSVFRTVKNSFLFACNKLPVITGVLIITFVPLIIVSFFGSTAATAVVVLLYAIIGFGNAVLVCTLYCQSCFDRLVNEKEFPEIFRKGLYSAEDEERYSDYTPSPRKPSYGCEGIPDFLRVENLSFEYDDERVLNSVSFSASSDDVLCIVGASGAGKTTLLKIMSGMTVEDGGDVFINGQSQSEIMPYKRKIGYAFQSPNLYTHMTVYQNIMTGITDKLKLEQKDERVKKMLELFCLTRYVNLKPKYLSEGERQRVQLAKALVSEKDLYLFDEPVSAMDVNGKRRALSAAAEICAARNRPLVYVSHDGECIFGIATKLAVLDGGVITLYGTPSEVAAKATGSVRELLYAEGSPFSRR